jgi:endo-1,4-beta-xylanase
MLKSLFALGAAMFTSATMADTTLATLYSGRMSIGAAVASGQLSSPVIATHFNSLVAEYEMKPAKIHPSENQWNFGPADQIANYARQHKMALRGHTLVWHRSAPDWMFQDGNHPASKELVLSRLKIHIFTVVNRYKDVVRDWDVVNEVIDPSQSDCFRRSPWFNAVGSYYIDAAFLYAHEADPTANLYINDYWTTDPKRQACLVQLVKSLKSRGIPVHGVGHQTHITIYQPSIDAMDRSLTVFENLGLENQITEIDISLYDNGQTHMAKSPTDLLAVQGTRYRDLMRVFIKHHIKSVTFWGVGDDHTWLSDTHKDDQPLLFDANGKPKPAFWGIVNAGRE